MKCLTGSSLCPPTSPSSRPGISQLQYWLQLLLILLLVCDSSSVDSTRAQDSSSKSLTSDDCPNEPNWHSLESEASARLNCGPAFEGRCRCERLCYESRHSYVVNCTNARFDDYKILAMLPNVTEVLIMTGNHFPALDWNVFGDKEGTLPRLRVVDLSNNAIEEIRGKSFHHVKNVETLILDFNHLSLLDDKIHPRLFSNFESLRELHLSDAFEDRLDKDLDEILYTIFANSNLTKLMKVHLEQNEIITFRHQPTLFCQMPNLLDIYLGDNFLDTLDADLDCLSNLRFLDLRRNKFRYVRQDDLEYMTSLAKSKAANHFQIDLTENPYDCTCLLNPFARWIKSSVSFLRNSNALRCRISTHKYPVPVYETKHCMMANRDYIPQNSTGATILLCSLVVVLISLVAALVYIQFSQFKQKIHPVIETVNKRVRYTSIATGDAQEINV